MRRVRRVRGQSAIEYVVLVVLAAAALAGMFGYIRSALSHRLKSGADGVGQGLLYP
jgi:Flp pilus assembly pilin Flp